MAGFVKVERLGWRAMSGWRGSDGGLCQGGEVKMADYVRKERIR